LSRKFVVIDGNSIINRAFYGIRLLSAPDGTYTNALLGFLNIFSKLMVDETPDGVCVCFDLKAPTFRHNAYDGYKAQRKGMPEELAVQLPILKEILDAMGVYRLELEGFEADDLLGTLSRKAIANGDTCVLVTGDRDSFQLVCDGVTMRYVSTRMGRTDTVLYDSLQLELDYGVTPPQFIEVKALMGDASDNIPGVKGIGEKTAFDLIRRFSSLDGVYENLDSPDIKPAARAKLEAGKESAYMSRMLAEIVCDAPVSLALEDLLRKEPNNDALYAILAKLELRSIITKFGLKAPKFAPAGTDTNAFTPRSSRTESDPAALSTILARSGPLAAAIDPSGKAIALADEAELIEFAAGSEDACKAALEAIFACGRPLWVHDSKALCHLCLRTELTPPAFAFDTLLAAYLLHLPLAFDALAEHFFNTAPRTDAPKADEQLDLFTAAEESAPASGTLAAQADLLLKLVPVLAEKIRADELEDLLYNVEMPLSEVIANMESDGFRIDSAALSAFGDKLTARITELEAGIYLLAGETFNINSPKQLGVILFEKLGLPARKKTKNGYSTNIDALKPLMAHHEIIGLILEYRALTKLRSTYVEGLLKLVGPDGRIRSTFDQTGTITGRLSSSEPNLQNIPVRSDPGSTLREMFSARDGYLLVDADYSQIELRILAHIADDKIMLDAFANGADIHTTTAAQVYDVPPEEITPRQRSSAKAVNFGIVYGISEFSLAEDIGSTRAEAKEMMDKYFAKYAGVKRYMEAVVAKAKEDGFVATLDHRRRYLPDIKSSNFNIRSAAERVALNTPIQGTAADIIKRAMVLVFRRLRREGMRARLILQVHDELIVEAPEDEATKVAAIVSEEMESAAKLNVRIAADCGIGKTWAEAKG